MKSECKYEKKGKWGVHHGGLNDHEGDSIIDARGFPQDLLHLVSHDE